MTERADQDDAVKRPGLLRRGWNLVDNTITGFELAWLVLVVVGFLGAAVFVGISSLLR